MQLHNACVISVQGDGGGDKCSILASGFYLVKKLVHVILGNMGVCLGPSFPKLGTCINLARPGDTNWKTLAIKIHDRRRSRVINAGDVRSLNTWMGIRYGGFREDDKLSAGMNRGSWNGGA